MDNINARETAMMMLYAESLGGNYETEPGDQSEEMSAIQHKESTFCRTLVEGVKNNETELREVISEYSQGWSIERIGKVELCILLIASFELLHLPDVPVGAAISEAVKLTKSYCDEKSAPFVNGILGSIARKYRS